MQDWSHSYGVMVKSVCEVKRVLSHVYSYQTEVPTLLPLLPGPPSYRNIFTGIFRDEEKLYAVFRPVSGMVDFHETNHMKNIFGKDQVIVDTKHFFHCDNVQTFQAEEEEEENMLVAQFYAPLYIKEREEKLVWKPTDGWIDVEQCVNQGFQTLLASLETVPEFAHTCTNYW